MVNWEGPDGSLGRYVAREVRKTLNSYLAQPNLVAEHASQEKATADGGYAHRQIVELAQNSADSCSGLVARGRIEIRLTDDYLYCADSGSPLDEDGVTALMFSNLSSKRGLNLIGRFGVGFKSVLGVTDAPEFFSRSASLRFDGEGSARLIHSEGVDADEYPKLRTPDPIDPHECATSDDTLRDLMEWATNVVRLPLGRGASGRLREQVREFPTEFLLFVGHLGRLSLRDDITDVSREVQVDVVGGVHMLTEGDRRSPWRVFSHTHRLSEDALDDWDSYRDSPEVPLWWAAPVERLREPGRFWAFFPTQTESLVAGILNAPWKTNSDRHNLLPGAYNDELIVVAANLIAQNIAALATQGDSGRHIEALPRRQEQGDHDQANLLRRSVYGGLRDLPVIPNQKGQMSLASDLHYPAPVQPEAIVRWEACDARPQGWAHSRALTRERLSRVEQIAGGAIDRAAVPSWLTALTSRKQGAQAIEASKAAIETAAILFRENTPPPYGAIVLTAADTFVEPHSGKVALPDESGSAGFPKDMLVHSELTASEETLSALYDLGVNPASPDSAFKILAQNVLGRPVTDLVNEEGQQAFWQSARKASAPARIVRECEGWEAKLRLRTRSGDWRPIHSVLLPGPIVSEEGDADVGVAVDVDFHAEDIDTLGALGVVDRPVASLSLRGEPWFREYLREQREAFRERPDLRSRPKDDLVNFRSFHGPGPLHVLRELSATSRDRYAGALLEFDQAFKPWVLRHTSEQTYPPLKRESPVIWMLRRSGVVEQESWERWRNHSQASEIREAFDLEPPEPEPVAESPPIPLTDAWPGLRAHLREDNQQAFDLIRCDRIFSRGETMSVHWRDAVYVVRADDVQEVRRISDALDLDLSDVQIDHLVRLELAKEVEENRAAVRAMTTDAERLLTAVGGSALRAGLPQSLLEVMEHESGVVTGTDIAEAAIATYDTGALKQFRQHLDHLDPPKQWAGSSRTVAFVESLGFSPAWAGERSTRRDPYEEAMGPRSLPPLHGYQQTIVTNIQAMLRGDTPQRRGMVTLPTGSGKTRVAVQAVVEAMRDGDLDGGVLWVADRDELCEQAVEAWVQVWASEGREAARLRISRLWDGQDPPEPAGDFHVAVASIQTLKARLGRSAQYEFLQRSQLVVLDEAHRSIAPTYTSAMDEIGFTRRRLDDEPLLLGLTATPYRGTDESETERLVNRYGRNRLDHGAFPDDGPESVMRELQRMEVLAHTDHEEIEGGTFRLTDEEEQKAHDRPWLPQSVEDRIGSDVERTRAIVDAYAEHVEPHNWPALIFATSVEHAKTVAALLSRRGVKARAVSSETERATRRKVVEEFRNGEILALVNYGVFREGFDAPKTRAIIVARPVYSPNLYFQMIGRGLRGPLNGGDDRCLILDVRDNIENYDRQLAFTELDWLWTS